MIYTPRLQSVEASYLCVTSLDAGEARLHTSSRHINNVGAFRTRSGGPPSKPWNRSRKLSIAGSQWRTVFKVMEEKPKVEYFRLAVEDRLQSYGREAESRVFQTRSGGPSSKLWKRSRK
ncbi:hypothetical protein J6590_018974 [Homalodisca vitripennis]|nr:hypothetical protein J6590_018974 [Homalodisca vitripennis]